MIQITWNTGQWDSNENSPEMISTGWHQGRKMQSHWGAVMGKQSCKSLIWWWTSGIHIQCSRKTTPMWKRCQKIHRITSSKCSPLFTFSCHCLSMRLSPPELHLGSWCSSPISSKHPFLHKRFPCFQFGFTWQCELLVWYLYSGFCDGCFMIAKPSSEEWKATWMKWQEPNQMTPQKSGEWYHWRHVKLPFYNCFYIVKTLLHKANAKSYEADKSEPSQPHSATAILQMDFAESYTCLA